jgi:hypothetical protein
MKFMNSSGTAPRLRWVLLLLVLCGLMGTGDFEIECSSIGGFVMVNGDCSK